MSLTSPVKDPSTATPPVFKPKPSHLSTASASSSVKLESSTPTSATTRPPPPPPPLPPPPSSDADVVFVPSYSRWFSWNNIHDCELRFLPEFFDSRSPSKNPRVYMYYRNSIITQFRRNPTAKITFTEVRKTLVGDVGSIRRVFDFLEAWGLINYSPSASSAKPLKWDDKDSKSSAAADSGGVSVDSAVANKDASKRLCSGCKSVCNIACFTCDKYDLTLCARCYVRGNYRVGVNSSDFRRVEISEETRTDWTEKETLQLLEAIMHYGDDWKKVAQHVGVRGEKDCITHFIKLPFGEQFSGFSHSGGVDDKNNDDADSGLESNGSSSPQKKMRLTPLADASNPIMAQVAFLSALVGTETAEAAAQAAVTTLTEVEYGANKGSVGSFARNTRQQDLSAASNGGDNNLNALERACLDANSLLEKEELDVERAISRIAGVEMKEILDKIVRFEELDMQLEKEWQQLDQMKNLLFVDQLMLLFRKSSAPKIGECVQENVKTD